MIFIENERFKTLFIALGLYLSSIFLFIFFLKVSYGNYYLQLLLPQFIAFSPFFLFALSKKGAPHQLISLKKLSKLDFLWITLLVVLLIFPLQVITSSLNSLLPNFEKEMAVFSKTIKATVLYNDLLGSLLLFAVIPALLEEVIFRGFLQGLIRKSGLGNFLSIVITALLFSLFHLNLLSYLPAFISGLIIGYLVIAKRSLYAAIYYHLLNNVIVVFSVFYGNETLELNLKFIKENLLWVLPLSILLLIIGLWVLFVKLSSNQKKQTISY